WNVVECSADTASGFLLPELDYSTPQVQIFKHRNAHEYQDEAIEKAFEEQVQVIRTKLAEMIRQHQPQAIHFRNILSLPIHPAATVAMAECIAEHPQIKFLAQHHDFSFEDDFVPGDRKKAYEIPYPNIQKRVEAALLYTTPQVQHAVINSLMQKSLLARFGYHAALIPDAFDFATQMTEIAKLRERLGVRDNDLLIGTMARIIPRKAMEVAVQFIVALRKRKDEFVGTGRGIHGRTITDDTRFFLLLPQASGLDEPENALYFKKLCTYAEEQGVDVLYLGDQIVADSAYEGQPDLIPFYSLYQATDILMFPSYQEGFGNQFLEAVALGQGVVVAHLYPVMEADILPRIPSGGVITLGTNSDYTLDEIGLVHVQEHILHAAVDQAIYLLLHPTEERARADETRQSLKAVFDASVVGKHISRLLSEE
ncbi:MAG TPA: hypothetical protein VFN35_25960, partial [Ktedonobacteraceae bacterium]|nr:hypothetical protein [Ktedonobacteraceae bacterium]